MYLHTKLLNYNKDIKVAFIGCGKFISMFLAQYNQLNKVKIDSIIELDLDKAKKTARIVVFQSKKLMKLILPVH